MTNMIEPLMYINNCNKVCLFDGRHCENSGQGDGRVISGYISNFESAKRLFDYSQIEN